MIKAPDSVQINNESENIPILRVLFDFMDHYYLSTDYSGIFLRTFLLKGEMSNYN